MRERAGRFSLARSRSTASQINHCFTFQDTSHTKAHIVGSYTEVETAEPEAADAELCSAGRTRVSALHGRVIAMLEPILSGMRPVCTLRVPLPP